ncbi:ClpXP protease specificity-enhancing factor [Sansalvadorimonas verongulae]|nr:ClpXP protease specificity-enhancing factor [Sansalvadorimonas verongulae]
MTSSRPYIIRALYDWIVDNECTPYLLVDALWPGVFVPPGFAEDDQVVLNVSPMAVRELSLDNEAVSFTARFNGKAYDVYVPVAGVMAIYARENGQGMVFEMEPRPEEETPAALSPVSEASAPTPLKPVAEKPVPEEDKQSAPKSGGDASGKKPKGRPSLKVVK